MKTQLINRSAMIGARFSDQSPGPLLVEDRFDAKSRSSRDPFSVFPVPAVRPGRASDAEQRVTAHTRKMHRTRHDHLSTPLSSSA